MPAFLHFAHNPGHHRAANSLETILRLLSRSCRVIHHLTQEMMTLSSDGTVVRVDNVADEMQHKYSSGAYRALLLAEDVRNGTDGS